MTDHRRGGEFGGWDFFFEKQIRKNGERKKERHSMFAKMRQFSPSVPF